MADHRLSATKKILFVLLALMLSVLVVEVGLRIASAVSPSVDAILGSGSSPTIPDEVLGHRPSPQMSDSDPAGFRNSRRPDSIEVVAIGDSQTFGMGVTRQQSWPHVLSRDHGVPTYSMAYGAYGATHYLVLAREALEQLDPRALVIGVYAGNDLFDAWNMVHVRGRLPELIPADLDPDTDLELAESTTPPPQFEWLRLRDATQDTSRENTGLRAFLSRHTQLYGLARAVKRTASRTLDTGAGAARTNPDPELIRVKLEGADPEMLLQVDAGAVSTVLTPGARIGVTDLSDQRIREGLRLTVESIRKIHLEAASRNAHTVVLMIPTKELVFAPWVDLNDHHISSPVQQLIRDESQVWNEITKLCDEIGAEYVDGLTPLRTSVELGHNPYFTDWDGHPNALGHQIIARTVAESETIRALARNLR